MASQIWDEGKFARIVASLLQGDVSNVNLQQMTEAKLIQIIEQRQQSAAERRIGIPLVRYVSDLRKTLVQKEIELSSRTNDLRVTIGQGMPTAISVYSKLGRLRSFFCAGKDMRSPQTLAASIAPEILAEIGLVFNPGGGGAGEIDRCTCVYCGAHFAEWAKVVAQYQQQQQQSSGNNNSNASTPAPPLQHHQMLALATDIHRRKSPSCPFLTGQSRDIPVASFQSTPRIARIDHRKWIIEHYQGPCTIAVPTSADATSEIHVFMCRGTDDGFVKIKTDGAVKAIYVDECTNIEVSSSFVSQSVGISRSATTRVYLGGTPPPVSVLESCGVCVGLSYAKMTVPVLMSQSLNIQILNNQGSLNQQKMDVFSVQDAPQAEFFRGQLVISEFDKAAASLSNQVIEHIFTSVPGLAPTVPSPAASSTPSASALSPIDSPQRRGGNGAAPAQPITSPLRSAGEKQYMFQHLVNTAVPQHLLASLVYSSSNVFQKGELVVCLRSAGAHKFAIVREVLGPNAAAGAGGTVGPDDIKIIVCLEPVVCTKIVERWSLGKIANKDVLNSLGGGEVGYVASQQPQQQQQQQQQQIRPAEARILIEAADDVTIPIAAAPQRLQFNAPAPAPAPGPMSPTRTSPVYQQQQQQQCSPNRHDNDPRLAEAIAVIRGSPEKGIDSLGTVGAGDRPSAIAVSTFNPATAPQLPLSPPRAAAAASSSPVSADNSSSSPPRIQAQAPPTTVNRSDIVSQNAVLAAMEAVRNATSPVAAPAPAPSPKNLNNNNNVTVSSDIPAEMLANSSPTRIASPPPLSAAPPTFASVAAPVQKQPAAPLPTTTTTTTNTTSVTPPPSAAAAAATATSAPLPAAGVGILLGRYSEGEGVEVVQILAGGAASASGVIKVGDFLCKVDEQPIREEECRNSNVEINRRIMGNYGEPVALTFKRGGRTLVVVLKRGVWDPEAKSQWIGDASSDGNTPAAPSNNNLNDTREVDEVDISDTEDSPRFRSVTAENSLISEASFDPEGDDDDHDFHHISNTKSFNPSLSEPSFFPEASVGASAEKSFFPEAVGGQISFDED